MRSSKRIAQYEVIKNDIIKDIKTGVLKSGEAAPSENQLIHRFGVSSTTARRALNELVAEGLVRRIQGKGSFIVPPEERRGNSKADVNYMVFIPGLKTLSAENSYDGNLIAGMHEFTFMKNVNLLFKDPEEIDEVNIFNEIRQRRIKGIAWARPSEQYYNLIRRISDSDLPQVTISRTVGDVPSIFFDSSKSLRNAISFLTRIGHLQIGFLDLKLPQAVFVERQKFVLNILKELGVSSPEKYLSLIDFDASEAEIINALDSIPHVTALVVLSPDIKIVKKWAALRNLRIPEDLSMVAVASEGAVNVSNSSVTSVIVEPRREIGNRAIQILNQQSAGKDISTDSIWLSGELIVRDSCAAPIKALKSEIADQISA